MKYFNTKKTILAGAFCLSLIGLGACQDDTLDMNGLESADKIPMKTLSADAQAIVKKVPLDVVIAHRGSTFWTPEETEVAFRWARNMGADYLELDLQRTKDGVLMALHDNNLKRTSNIESVFPGQEDLDVTNFTLIDLRRLDAGSWFNIDKPENASAKFAHQQVSTLQDAIMIAEGYKVLRSSAAATVDVMGEMYTYPLGMPYYMKKGKKYDKTVTYTAAHADVTSLLSESDGHFCYVVDETDTGNRPGIYPETKEPWRFGGMELDLAKELLDLGWAVSISPAFENDYIAKVKKGDDTFTAAQEAALRADIKAKIAAIPGSFEEYNYVNGTRKSNIGKTYAKVITQTFSWQSMELLDKYLSKVPKCMLLWKGGYDNLKNDTPEMIADVMDFCVDKNVHIVGPSIGGAPNKYYDLTAPWMCKMYHKPGFIIHAYSFDTQDQLKKYNGDYYYEKLSSRFNEDGSAKTRTLAGEWKGKIDRSNFIDGGFTNLTDLSMEYQGKGKGGKTARQILGDLGI